MMRRIPVLTLIICLLACASITSCHKEEKQPSLASRFPGKWKKVQYATDDNANGALDEWEIHDVDAGLTNVLEFREDSTGTEYTTNSPDLSFTWAITNELSMTFAYKNSEVILYKITRVNSGVLNLTCKTKNGLAGYYYEKQK